jgi:diguanylate cyclase (GGDEF)-like protein/putative nucleotidyltransferase with HDIG domain
MITVMPAPQVDYNSPPERSRLSSHALVYLMLVAATAAVATIAAFARMQPPTTKIWWDFAILVTGAAFAQLFVVTTTRNQSMHAALVFAIPATMVLPPGLIVLMAAAIHIPEWLKARYPWFIQTFNICNWMLSALAAWAIGHAILSLGGDDKVGGHYALAGLAAAAVFVLLNHLLLSTMLKLARGHSFAESGLFGLESLGTDFVIAALGTVVAALWRIDPWVVPAALAPLLLIHRSLSVPGLQEQARVDPKTGLFNARHFGATLTEELGRAQRFDRPLALMMADLDLLREINNTYGHLAGDSVLQGVAAIFRTHLRHYDVPARFGGEEFAIVLPETTPEHALAIAERIRQSVAEATFDVDTSSEPVRATISIGVAGFPKDATDAQELVHQADLAVYRAKLQGRNRVLAATDELLVVPESRTQRAVTLAEDGTYREPLSPAPATVTHSDRRHPRPHAVSGAWFARTSGRLASLVLIVGAVGIAAGVVGLLVGGSTDYLGLAAIVALAGAGQALAIEFDENTISVGAVGALAGAALFGPKAALPLAVASVSVAWSALRNPIHQVLFNIGSLTLAGLAAAGIFAIDISGHAGQVLLAGLGLLAGAVYYLVNMGLLSGAVALEAHHSWQAEWKERFGWLITHYVAYGFVGAVIAIAYHAAGLYAIAAFAVPLLVLRQTQQAYISHAQRSTQKLRNAAETIQTQNISLEEANKALRDRSTAAMESLSATVDARDTYTAGHSRRVQELALAIGRELDLSQAELDLLGHAALFHDIGKLAVPDAILLKPGSLSEEEWGIMQRHSDEGARIIDRLGFLADAVPAIRHHHERYDGTGYPDFLRGDEIPLGARVIHVADAIDSMLTNRVYRPAMTIGQALNELDRHKGKQFCPRCVEAAKRVTPRLQLTEDSERGHLMQDAPQGELLRAAV